jgi:hypothetical protein
LAFLLAQAHGRSISDGKRRWLEYEGEHRLAVDNLRIHVTIDEHKLKSVTCTLYDFGIL